jgi:hypothetical protein
VRATELSQPLDLLCGLDAFDDHALTEVLRQRYDGGQHI